MSDPSPAESIKNQVLETFPPDRHGDGEAPELAERLGALATADSLESRLDALVALVEWTRHGEASLVEEDPAVGRERLRSAARVLEMVPAARRALQDLFGEIVSETEGVSLFGETGIPNDRGFLAEFVDRLLGRLLPRPADVHDLSRLVTRLYRAGPAVERFTSMPPDFFHRLVELIAPPDRPEAWAPIALAFSDGFRLLALRVESQGLSKKLRARSRPCAVTASPFYKLNRLSDDLVEAWRGGTADFGVIVERWNAACAACRDELDEIHRRLESEGVSIDIVYGMDVIERCLTRMGFMVAIMVAQPGTERSAAIHTLLSRLIMFAHQDRSAKHLLDNSMQLLERKIVERSGKTGEHYVARNLREYRHIWLAAAGGGLLTVLTAAVKLKVSAAGMPLFIEGLAAGLNYAVAFLLLHHLGLMLATKQPAMTAARLATLVQTRDRGERLDNIVEFMVRICHSQFAAASANVLIVFVGAFMANVLWVGMTGRDYLDPEEASQVFASLSPVSSGTVFYAALTGVILWLAAMIGGWLDNWSAYHRLPQGIADHPLGRRVGRRRMVRFGGIVARNMSGWGTSISLGFLLGLTPVFGQFFGLPLDVRHVTLHSGMLAFACAGLDGWFTSGWFLWALAGVATMFVLNLSVSFLLSLYTAVRAYNLPTRELAVLGARLGRRFYDSPLDFVLPRGLRKSKDEE